MFDFFTELKFKINGLNNNIDYMSNLILDDKRLFRFASQELKSNREFILSFPKKDYENKNGTNSWSCNYDMPKSTDVRRFPLIREHVQSKYLLIYAKKELLDDPEFILDFLSEVERYKMPCYRLHMAIPQKFIYSHLFWLEYLTTRQPYSWILRTILFEHHPKFQQTQYDVSSNDPHLFFPNAKKALEYLMSVHEADKLNNIFDINSPYLSETIKCHETQIIKKRTKI